MARSISSIAANLYSAHILLALTVVVVLGALVTLHPQWLRACIVHLVVHRKAPARSQAWRYRAFPLCPPLLPQFMINSLLDSIPTADNTLTANSARSTSSVCYSSEAAVGKNSCSAKESPPHSVQTERSCDDPPGDADAPDDCASDPDHSRKDFIERSTEWSPVNDRPLFDNKHRRMYQPEPIGHRPSMDGAQPPVASRWVQLFSLSPTIPVATLSHLRQHNSSPKHPDSMYLDSEFSLFSEPFAN